MRNAGSAARLFDRGSWPEVSRIAAILRRETVGGILLLGAAAVAMVWANSPWGEAYTALRDTRVGPAAWHLDLSLGAWAADGLLAVFFFVAGLELKRELVAGDLRDPWRAAVPVAAAVGGVLVPSLFYLLVAAGAGPGAADGWAVPTATDIAFALAVLALIGGALPSALRTFLLALAVVDDLIAITIIAVAYTDRLQPWPAAAAAVTLAAFAVLVRRGVRSPWLLLPPAVATWALVHASGVHATVAGVLLGFAVPVLAGPRGNPGDPGPAEHFEHRFRPLSAAVAVPVFAFFAAGVTVGGGSGLVDALSDPVALGVVLGLVIGKPLGILLATWAVARATRAELADGLRWSDVAALAVLSGIGFTVSLLIGELAFGVGTPRGDAVKVGVLAGSLAAAVLASVLLRARTRSHRRILAEEELDSDGDGVPDRFAAPPPG